MTNSAFTTHQQTITKIIAAIDNKIEDAKEAGEFGIQYRIPSKIYNEVANYYKSFSYECDSSMADEVFAIVISWYAAVQENPE